MTDIFQLNIDALKEIYPVAAQNILNLHSKDMESSKSISHHKTKNDLLNFKLAFNERTFFLHSSYDPLKEAESWVSRIDLAGYDTIAVLGIGLGYHIQELISKYPLKNKVIIEPNEEVFLELMKAKDIRDIILAQNTLLIVNSNTEQIGKIFLEFRQEGKIDNVYFEELPSYRNIYGNWWYSFKKEYIKYAMLYQINTNTSVFYAENWITNFFENIKQYPMSVGLDKYKSAFKGIPAIIVSAGPSLNKNAHLLKQLTDKALIISSGSAINILESRGITPHIMVGVDGGENESKLFNNVKSQDIYFAYMISVHFDGLNKYKGPKLYFSTDSMEYSTWFENEMEVDTNRIDAGSSVSNISLDIGRLLGCNPLVLIGQDLSYPNMQSYADGAVLKEIQDTAIKKHLDEKNRNYILEKDFEGNEVYTIPSFNSIRLYFEEYVAKHTDLTFLNGTEGGLPIKGIPNRPLKEIIEEYCKSSVNIQDILKNIYKSEKYADKDKEARVEKFFEKIDKECGEIKRKAIDRMDLLLEIISDLDSSENGKKWKKIEKLTNEIEETDLHKYFVFPLCNYFIQAIKNERERKVELITGIEEKRLYLYEGLLLQYTYIKDKIVLIQELCKKSITT